jgi:hypothetical protein
MIMQQPARGRGSASDANSKNGTCVHAKGEAALDSCLLGMAAGLTVMQIKRTHGTKSRDN